MSWSLIKKGLDLIEKDLDCSKNSVEKKTNAPKRRPGDGKLKKKRLNNLTHLKVSNALESYKKSGKGDQTLKNLEALKKADKFLNANGSAVKVKEHHVNSLKKKVEDQTGDLIKFNKETEKSVFSEEDFERMNNEWLTLYQR